MPLTVKHAFVSGKPAGPDASKVQGPHWDADHQIIGTGLMPVGTVLDYAGYDVPTGWLECYGQAVAAASYPALFAKLVKYATVTITQPASPTVVSWTGHGLKIGDDVSFSTTGVLPGGILDNDIQKYRILSAGFSANSFRISLTWEGAAIATVASPAQSGVHTGVHAPYGVTTGLTQFKIPDLRSTVLAGISNMGGVNSTKLASGYQMGFEAGAETVVLVAANLPPHAHTIPTTAVARTDNPALGTRSATVAYNTAGSTGNGPGTSTPVNKMQPTEFIKKIIYTGL